MRFAHPDWSATVASENVPQTSATASYESRKGWLPITLQRPYLLFLSAILLVLAVGIEALRQYSIHPGIVIYKRKEDILSDAWRAWTNLPTILAVFVTVLWEACSQDILRLEPYFQLSRACGAPAAVLFVTYHLDNTFLAVIRAARNRHWIVLCVSFMSLLMRILVPSLSSGLFLLDRITLIETRTVDTWPYLVDRDTQERWFSAATAYGNMGTGLPDTAFEPHRSSRYAIGPLSNPLDYGDVLSTLTLNQSVYWSSMICTNVTLIRAVPATTPSPDLTLDLKGNREFSWNLRGITLPEGGVASGCVVSIEIDTFVSPLAGRLQARYWESPHAGAGSPTLSAFTVNNCSFALVGVMFNIEDTPETSLQSNMTVFACEPMYQQATANVSRTWDSTITDVQIMSSTVKDLTGSEFSTEGFKRLMSSGRTPTDGHEVLGGLRAGETATQSGRGTDRSRVAVVADSDILHLMQYQERVSNLWNAAFVTTIDRFFDPAAQRSHVEAQQVRTALALTVVPQAALVVESILFLGCLLLLSLSRIYPRRPNILLEDPSSIVAQCACIARLICPKTLQALNHPGYHLAKTRELRRWAKGFWCGWRFGTRGPQIGIFSRDGRHVQMCPPPSAAGRSDPMPHFLTAPWFAIEGIFLIGSVAAFALALKFMQSQKLDSSTSTEIVIWSTFLIYAPTILSTMIRSFMNSVHRQFSIAEPWIRLRRGTVSPEVLVTSSYGAPTTIVVTLRRGFRFSPAMMALSFVCLLNSALVIVSGGIYEPQVDKYSTLKPNLTSSYNSSMFLRQGPGIDFTGYDSAVYSSAMNQSSAPWSTTDLTFLPLATDELDDTTDVLYTAVTRGIETHLDCQVVSHVDAFTDYESRTVNWTYSPFDSPNNVLCNIRLPLDDSGENTDKGSVRYIWPDDADPRCQRLTFFVLTSWARNASAPLDQDNSPTLHCEPRISIQDFHVQFDHRGVIQRYEQVASSFITSGPFFKNASEALGDFNQGLGRFLQHLHPHGHRALYRPSALERKTAQVYNEMKHDIMDSDDSAWIGAVQSVYQTVFSNYLALRRDQFLRRLDPSAATPVDGTATYTIWGLIPSKSRMIVIITLISVDVLALSAVFLLYRGPYDAPRIPRSLGSLIPWVAQSRMLHELTETSDMDDKQRERFLQQEGRQYHFWPFSNADSEKLWVLDYVQQASTQPAAAKDIDNAS